MKTYKSILLIALFLISTIAVLPVQASTGHPILGTTNVFTVAAVFTPAVFNVSARAGTMTAVHVDGLAPPTTPAYFAIQMNGVTFSGSQFSLYLSHDGLSQISTGDILYTGYFQVAQLTAAAISTTTFTGAIWQGGTSPTFYYGTVAGAAQVVIGPAPFNIPGGPYYVKVYDGSTTAVAVSTQQLNILPNIFASPTTPIPAGYTVSVTGVAWAIPGLVNVSVSDPAGTAVSTDVTPDANGAWSWTFAEPDENLRSGTNGIPNWPWATLITAFNTSSATQPQTASSADLTVTTTVNFIGRAFYNFISRDNSGTLVSSSVYNTAMPGDGTPTFTAKVLGTFYVNGTNFNPSGNVTAYADWGAAGQVSLPLTFVTALTSKGGFNASFQVPVLSLGNHKISFVDASWSWNFTITILTTLIISPTKGPQGTSVTATGYGFTPSVPYTLWWFGMTFANLDADTQNILEASGNTTATGSFTATFTVPTNVYGGAHDVGVNTTAPDYSFATFTVTPTFSLSASTAALGTLFNLLGVGLPTGSGTYSHSVPDANFTAITDAHTTGATAGYYIPTYDNAFSALETGYDYGIRGNNTGYAAYPLIAAGVPMMHYVGVVSAVPLAGGPYTNVAILGINVTGSTTEGAQILAQSTANGATLASMQATLTSLQTSVASLTTTAAALQTSLASLTTTVNGISTSVGASLASSVTALQTSVTSLTTSVGGLSSSLGSLSTSVTNGFSGVNTAVSGAQSALTTAINKVDTDVTGVGSSVTALSGTLGTVSTSVSAIKTATDAINTATSNISTITTVLYIAVILAAIAVVLEILILIRKK